VGLFVAEAKVASYGLLTVGGLVAMILGGSMLVVAPVPEMQVGLQVLVPAALAVAAFVITLLRLVLRARKLPVTTGQEGLVGLSGRADTPLDPEGWVIVSGERWRARATAPVPAGGRVVVTSVEGLALGVRAEE